MTRIDTTTEEWFPNLNSVIEQRGIPAFPTAKAAQEVAKKFGWSSKVIRCDRRFERCYIVGAIDFQPDTIAGVTVDILRVPMLKWTPKQAKQAIVCFHKNRNN